MSAAGTSAPVSRADRIAVVPDAATDVQHPARRLRLCQELVGGDSPAGVDHPFAQYGEELV